jgi:acetyl esterase/lipase
MPTATVPFRQHPTLELDIYQPEGEGPWPTALVIHGGGFVGGSRSMKAVACLVADLLRQRFLTASVSYRLARPWGARLAHQADDVQAAASAWPAIAERYGGDPERSALLGMSAGGALALLATPSARFQRFVGIYGAYDLELLPAAWVSARLLVGGPPKVWPAHNPISNARFVQPALVVHGLADPLTPPAHAESLVAARAGLPTTPVWLPGAVHGYLQDGPDHPDAAATLTAIRTFLDPLRGPS